MNALPESPFIRTLSRLRAAFWRRRFLHGLVRAAWLALLVPVAVMAGYLWRGWHVPLMQWLSVAILVALVALIWALRPIGLKQMTRKLDRLLRARAKLITAFEVSQSAPMAANPVADQLVQEAVNLTADARQQVRLFNRGFWLELQALIAVSAMLGALLIFDALTPNIPHATPVELPLPGSEARADTINPPDASLQPPPFQPPQQSPAEQVQAALEALANALRDQAASRAAAEAIDSGDLAQAAAELRRLADQLEELSPEAQRELGNALGEAAENIGSDVPGFTPPLRQGSQSLAQEDVTGGSRALEDLAETLDRLAEEAGQAGNGSAQGGEPADTGRGDSPGDAGGGEGGESNQPLGDAAERLPIDGQPLELDSALPEDNPAEQVLQPAELDAQGNGRTTDSPFARQPLNATGADLGADPLTYPWNKREIVRQYFTPNSE